VKAERHQVVKVFETFILDTGESTK